MAFKTQPIGAIASANGYDWTDVAKRAAQEIAASDYRIYFLYGSSRPSNALNPLAAQRVTYAFERLGVGGALPVLSFFGTPKTWTDAAATVVRALGYETAEGWSSVLDANDNPIRVIEQSGSKLCFAINVYGPTRSDLESRSVETAESDTDEAADDEDNGNAEGDMELEFSD